MGGSLLHTVGGSLLHTFLLHTVGGSLLHTVLHTLHRLSSLLGVRCTVGFTQCLGLLNPRLLLSGRHSLPLRLENATEQLVVGGRVLLGRLRLVLALPVLVGRLTTVASRLAQ